MSEKVKYKKVIADIGAGDAKQTIRLARKNPNNLYYAIEPNYTSYKDTERKASRKESKGGVQNIRFINSSIEQIPDELSDTFDEIQINFPWGTLLEGVIIPLPNVLESIVKIAKPNCKIIIITTYDDKFEKEFRVSRGLPKLSIDYIQNKLSLAYQEFGLLIKRCELITDNSKLAIDSPWGKKLISARQREVFLIKCIVNKRQIPPTF